MAALGSGNPTFADWAKTLDPDGKTAVVAELLSQTNAVIDDIHWVEGNLPTGHRCTVRTGLPAATWRQLNGGVAATKGTTAQIDEACGMLEAWSVVDKDLALLNGNVNAFRMIEARAHAEAMAQEFVGTLFYGNSAIDTNEFTGLAPRYNDLDATNGQNIINGGGSGSDNSSVWLVCWGPNTVHGIFPKGSKAGLIHEDHGEVTTVITAGLPGSMMRAYEERWQWKAGIALKDWRYAVRMCNIDISALVAKSSAADLVEGMIKMTHRIPNLKMGKPAFYMNRTCFQMLDIQGRDDAMAGGGLSYMMVEGKPMYTFRGIPVRICDQLTEAEAAVTT